MERDWKSSYFEQLATHEADVKRWAEVDSLLRRTASRLALATEGLTPELDERCDALRVALKNTDDTARLRSELDALSALLNGLDGRGAERRYLAGTDAISELLNSIEWPRELRRDAQRLRKELRHCKFPGDVQTFFSPLRELFQRVRVSSIRADAGDARRPFSIGRMLRKFTKSSRILPDATLRLVAAIQQRSGYAGLSDRVAQKITIDDSLGDDVLASLVHELADALHESTENSAAFTVSDTGAPAPKASINSILLSLLDRISLPAEQQSQLGLIRERVQQIVSSDDWPELLEEIADLVAQMRESVESEKRDLEKFLTQVMLSLQELDVKIQGAASQQDAAHRDGEVLNAAVASGVREITDSLENISDVDQLKKIVQVRLDHIRRHMDDFHDAESSRHHEQDKQMRMLVDRLHELEVETETLRSRVREQRQRALNDPLTGIFNRLAYDERVELEYLRWKRFRQPLTLMVWDIDNFKTINDRFGHKVGDKVLVAVAQSLSSLIRESDFVARYGGEEFVTIAPGTGGKIALQLADKFRERVASKKFRYQEQDIPITLSCGLAEFEEGMSPDEVFSRADAALYSAKQFGRNRCELATIL